LPRIPELSIIVFKQRFKKVIRLDVSLRDVGDRGLRDIRERLARLAGFKGIWVARTVAVVGSLGRLTKLRFKTALALDLGWCEGDLPSVPNNPGGGRCRSTTS
jgi:hypothetical protein